MLARDILRRYPLFAVLGQDRLGPWLASGQEVAAGVGETLFQAGTPGRHLYLLREGNVRVLRPNKEGRDVSLGQFQPGDLFGEYALIPPGLNTATCRQSSPGRLWRLPLGPLREAIAERLLVQANLKTWLRLHALLCYLRDGPFLGFMSATSLLPLLDRFQTVQFLAGRTIQAEGLSADRLFIIRRGHVRLHPPEEDRSEPRLLKPGDYFGAEALVGEEELPLAEAQTDTQCLCLHRDGFYQGPAGGAASLQTYREELRPSQRLHVWVAQEGATDCGVAALAMVARFHGLDVTLSKLRAGMRVGPRGTSLLDLEQAAAALGLRARAVHVGLEQLVNVSLPAIAHQSGEHYVVVYALAPDGIVVGDPAAGIVKTDLARFRQSWTGTLLLLRPPGQASSIR
jgi:ATP-binding cassette subfamily B protein